ncbi:MAG TPA: tetratricopeptide repeat protein [Ktedonobacterales bacterium]|nr:tetratricopeptide repeat protein [Ktedonobacterales bacterium]
MSAERLSLFGALLRRHRAAAGLTQEELAERAGLSARAVSDLERGRKRMPRKDTVALLATALSLSPRQREAFAAAARGGLAPGASAASEAPSGLPVPLTGIVGREREIREALGQLERTEVRQLTFTGPGGVGKSRLALEVAREVCERFDDGAVLVELAPLREPEAVMPALSRALGVRETPGAPLDALIQAHLRSKRTLLLLDNFEHLLESAPQVAALLAAAPRCTALVTSREPLRIHGEHVLPVAPLAVEAAAELFLHRVRASGADLDPGLDERALAEAICRRVDCLPLAIELAAVRARALPLPALLERLSHRLDLLSRGPRDLPDRQRTMRDAIAWSYHLLDSPERRLFRRLSVFAGGWTLEAAEATCGDSAETAADGVSARDGVLDGLASLVDHSLIHTEAPRGQRARFSMLETIREYARERLAESADVELMQRRHAEYFARQAETLVVVGPDQDARDRELERDMANVRVALEWARDHSETTVGLRLVTGFGRFWYYRGALSEGEGWVRAMLATDAAAGARRALPAVRMWGLYAATRLALNRRAFDEAEALAEEGLHLARQADDASGIARMLAELGHVAQGRGDLETALARFEESLAYARQAGDENAVGMALSNLGNLARARQDYPQAKRYLEEALVWSEARHYSWGVAGGYAALGHVAVEEGDVAGAAAHYRRALQRYRALPNPAWLAWCAQGIAVVAEAAGDHERAARLAGAIARLRAAATSESSEQWALFDGALRSAREALGERAYDGQMAAGARLGTEETFALAERIVGASGRATC